MKEKMDKIIPLYIQVRAGVSSALEGSKFNEFMEETNDIIKEYSESI